jgi:hypothetical protein
MTVGFFTWQRSQTRERLVCGSYATCHSFVTPRSSEAMLVADDRGGE